MAYSDGEPTNNPESITQHVSLTADDFDDAVRARLASWPW